MLGLLTVAGLMQHPGPYTVQAAGSFHGHAVYGIRTLTVHAPRLQSIIEECGSAAKSNDARDKYFATYVGEFASCSSKALRSELPSLEVGVCNVCVCVSPLPVHCWSCRAWRMHGRDV